MDATKLLGWGAGALLVLALAGLGGMVVVASGGRPGGDGPLLAVPDAALPAGSAPAETPTPLPPSATATATPCAGLPAPFPDIVVHAAGAYFPADGRFYVLGGYGPAGAYTNPHAYDPAANTWTTRTATFPDAQVSDIACAVLSAGGTQYIYCVGGAAPGQASATSAVRRYDPIADQLSVIASDPWPGDANGTTLPGGVAVANDKLYILGGFNISVAATREIWEFDPAAPAGNRWTQKVDAPVDIMYAPAATLNGIIYVAGASDYQGGTIVDTTHSFRFDPVANTVGAIAPIPRATGETRAVPIAGRMWVLGGGRVAPNPGNEVDIYDPATNTWTLGAPLPVRARSFAADGNGSCFWAVGGVTNSGSSRLLWAACPPPCATATATPPAAPSGTATPGGPTSTPSPSATPPPSATPAPPTTTPVASATPLPTSATPMASATTVPPTNTVAPSAVPCAISFGDVRASDYFYEPVRYLYCHGVISGYADGTFRPYNDTTRAQMVKIVVLGFARALAPPAGGAYTFADVAPSHPFFAYVETAAGANIVSGYACGGVGEPCDAQHRPYFRPGANVTRGQLAKIDVVAGGWVLITPVNGTFADVVPESAFYPFVETAACRGVISGYTCGGPGEPCDAQHRPYYRQGADAVRGQIAKIVYLSITGTGSCLLAP